MAAFSIFGGATGAVHGYSTVRWVSSAADGAGDGTTSTVGGATGAWTLTQAMAASPGVSMLILIMDDGAYTGSSAGNLFSSGTGGTTGYKVFAGTDNQNGANANGGRPHISQTGNGNVIAIGNAGHWLEKVEVSGSGANSGVIANAHTVVWDCICHGNADYGIITGGATGFTTVAFCELYDNDLGGIASGANAGGIDWMVMFNKIHDNGVGVFSDHSTILLCNEIYDNVGSGIITESSGVQAIDIWFNLLDGNGGAGIEIAQTDVPALIVGNLISNNATYGVDVTSGSPLMTISLLNNYFNHASDHFSTTDVVSKQDTLDVDPDYVSTTNDAEDFLPQADLLRTFGQMVTTGDEEVRPGPTVFAGEGSGGSGAGGAETRFNAGYN